MRAKLTEHATVIALVAVAVAAVALVRMHNADNEVSALRQQDRAQTARIEQVVGVVNDLTDLNGRMLNDIATVARSQRTQIHLVAVMADNMGYQVVVPRKKLVVAQKPREASSAPLSLASRRTMAATSPVRRLLAAER
jgi:hypothetical protein